MALRVSKTMLGGRLFLLLLAEAYQAVTA